MVNLPRYKLHMLVIIAKASNLSSYLGNLNKLNVQDFLFLSFFFNQLILTSPDM